MAARSKGAWVGLLMGLALVVAIAMQSTWRAWLGNNFAWAMGLVAVCAFASIALRKLAPMLAGAWAVLGAGLLVILAFAQAKPRALDSDVAAAIAHDHEHAHQAEVKFAPLTSPMATTDESINADTKFGYVLVFAQDVDVQIIEGFRESVIKQVHVQGCVRNLPCIARLLRLFEIGPARTQVIAFDLMNDTPIAERNALISAIKAHPLNPGVYQDASANDTARASESAL